MPDDRLTLVHAELLGQFHDIKRVLDKHQIPYAMMHGTLLGVVRHKGFIPWDDDIDLILTRDNFERFEAVYPKERDKRYRLTYTNTWTPRVMSETPVAADAFTDFFILDNFPDSAFARRVRLLRLRLLQGMLKRNADYSRFSFKQRVLLRLTHVLGLPFSVEKKTRWYHRISTATKKSREVHMSNAAFGLLPMTFHQADFEDLIQGEFEGMKVLIPRNYDGVLKKLFGPDYMTPPPPEQRVAKHLDL